MLQILRYQIRGRGLTRKVFIMRDANRKNKTKKDLNQESTTESSAKIFTQEVTVPYALGLQGMPQPFEKLLTIKRGVRTSVPAGKFSALMMTVHQKAQRSHSQRVLKMVDH